MSSERQVTTSIIRAGGLQIGYISKLKWCAVLFSIANPDSGTKLYHVKQAGGTEHLTLAVIENRLFKLYTLDPDFDFAVLRNLRLPHSGKQDRTS